MGKWESEQVGIMRIGCALSHFITSSLSYYSRVVKIIQGKRIGLITNPSGVNRNLQMAPEVFVVSAAPDVSRGERMIF